MRDRAFEAALKLRRATERVEATVAARAAEAQSEADRSLAALDARRAHVRAAALQSVRGSGIAGEAASAHRYLAVLERRRMDLATLADRAAQTARAHTGTLRAAARERAALELILQRRRANRMQASRRCEEREREDAAARR